MTDSPTVPAAIAEDRTSFTSMSAEEDYLKGMPHFDSEDDFDTLMKKALESCRKGLYRPFEEVKKELFGKFGLM